MEQLVHERLTRTHDIQVDLELIMRLKNRNSLQSRRLLQGFVSLSCFRPDTIAFNIYLCSI